MNTADITVALMNSAAETIIEELRRRGMAEDEALTVLAGLCWILLREFRPVGDIDEDLSELCKQIYECDGEDDDDDLPPEPSGRLH